MQRSKGQLRNFFFRGGNLTLTHLVRYEIVVFHFTIDGFGVSTTFYIGFSVFVPKNFGFSVLVTISVSVLFRSRFSVFGKNKIGFSDLLFDAVWCFSGFSSENMRLDDLNSVHASSDFVCGFRFSSKFISVLWVLLYSNAPSLRNRNLSWMRKKFPRVTTP